MAPILPGVPTPKEFDPNYNPIRGINFTPKSMIMGITFLVLTVLASLYKYIQERKNYNTLERSIFYVNESYDGKEHFTKEEVTKLREAIERNPVFKGKTMFMKISPTRRLAIIAKLDILSATSR